MHFWPHLDLCSVDSTPPQGFVPIFLFVLIWYCRMCTRRVFLQSSIPLPPHASSYHSQPEKLNPWIQFSLLCFYTGPWMMGWRKIFNHHHQFHCNFVFTNLKWILCFAWKAHRIYLNQPTLSLSKYLIVNSSFYCFPPCAYLIILRWRTCLYLDWENSQRQKINTHVLQKSAWSSLHICSLEWFMFLPRPTPKLYTGTPLSLLWLAPPPSQPFIHSAHHSHQQRGRLSFSKHWQHSGMAKTRSPELHPGILGG